MKQSTVLVLIAMLQTLGTPNEVEHNLIVDDGLSVGLNTRKPVFGVSDKASFKHVSSAAETSQKIETAPVAS